MSVTKLVVSHYLCALLCSAFSLSLSSYCLDWLDCRCGKKVNHDNDDNNDGNVHGVSGGTSHWS